MKVLKTAHDVVVPLGYRAWRITWPYKTERYLVFGPKVTAEAAEKRFGKDGHGKKWPYRASIREIKL
jgi:hypothetical protein